MPQLATKVRVPNLELARGVCRNARAELLETEHLVETYFRTPRGRLKLRESSACGCDLIPFVAPGGTRGGQPSYCQLPVATPEQASQAKALLRAILGEELVVEKQRQTFLVKGVRVHLDEITGVGSFLEFDAMIDPATGEYVAISAQKVIEMMLLFAAEQSALEARSYYTLVKRSRGDGQISRGYLGTEEIEAG